jgi:SAM-dependent methyltransferase
VCGSDSFAETIRRERLPVLQNRVYGSRAEARSSPCAPFQLATCLICGFSFNRAFDGWLMVYDEHYDNDVPSNTFRTYYEIVADMLIRRLELTSGVVYDIGCGKGDFLRTLCRLAPNVVGIGIDPSCSPIESGNFALRKETFQAETFAHDTRLVILRHVLEHIDQPVAFAAMIAEQLGDAPLYVEVPDLDWILENGAFWDFCYEHCNYFTPHSLAFALRRAGFLVEAQGPGFGGQYQWAICRRSAEDAFPSMSDARRQAELVAAYRAHEGELIAYARRLLAESGNAVIWGMATKGVIFSTLLDCREIAGGVDINPKKQGRFVPGSGLQVHPPEWLATLTVDPTVLVMNGNYAEEIREEVRRVRASARVVVL